MSVSRLLELTPEKTIEVQLILFTSLTEIVKLKNVSDSFVAFKIKTTAPKNYLVRPSTGSIPKGGSIDIQIILQPLVTPPPASHTHRFLVQCAKYDTGDAPPKEFWLGLDKADIEDHKLSVVFQEPGGGDSRKDRGGSNNATSDVASSHEAHGGDTTDLSTKYEELVRFAVSLEKKNHEYRAVIDRLERAALADDTNSPSKQTSVAKSGYELWHVVAIVILVVAFLKLFSWL